jgi:imidazoleglycerol-phosphate dehydratase
MPARTGNVDRKTSETSVRVAVDLGNAGRASVSTGIGFFDHMLEQIARHGRIGLTVEAKGDLHVDMHHTVEDVGLALGDALAQALGDKAGIERYGHARVPMMESLAEAALDICGRPFLVFNAELKGNIGELDSELVEEFFRSVAARSGMTLHIDLVRCGNRHHAVEAIFKAFATALRRAVSVSGTAVPSTKGVL